MTDTRCSSPRYALAFGLVALILLAGGRLSAQPIIPDPNAVPSPSHALAITGATVVVRPGEVLTDATVVIRRGLIESVGRTAPPFDARVIDGSGLTIYAGFIDAYSCAGMDAPGRQ